MNARAVIWAKPRLSGLYAITRDEPDSGKLASEVDLALQGGARIVQYRNKAAPLVLAREQASMLRDLTLASGAALIINDDVELALAVCADGVHLGRDDKWVAAARTEFHDIRQRANTVRQAQGKPSTTPFLVGISCYNELERAQAAADAGADYLAFGSIFPSSTKPHARRADLSLIGAAKQRFMLPVVAIGGITPENAPQLIAAGVDAIAVISSLFDAENIKSRAQQFSSLFPDHV